jgi:hypothetical protein
VKVRADEDLAEVFEAKFVRPLPGPALVVGSHLYGKRADRRERYAKAIGVDMQEGPGVDRVLNLEDKLPKDLGPFAHIDCLSVLEHSRRPWLLAANLERLVLPEGTVFLTVPFVWRIHGYPSDFWRFTLDGVRELFPRIDWLRLMFAHVKLTPKSLVPARGSAEHGCPLLPRTQVCGFGVRRP